MTFFVYPILWSQVSERSEVIPHLRDAERSEVIPHLRDAERSEVIP
jgi:hypothetical protein